MNEPTVTVQDHASPQNAVDMLSALAYLAGPSTMTVASAFGDAWPGHAKAIVALAGGIVFSAGLLLRLFKNRTGTPTTIAAPTAQKDTA